MVTNSDIKSALDIFEHVTTLENQLREIAMIDTRDWDYADFLDKEYLRIERELRTLYGETVEDDDYYD